MTVGIRPREASTHGHVDVNNGYLVERAIVASSHACLLLLKEPDGVELCWATVVVAVVVTIVVAVVVAVVVVFIGFLGEPGLVLWYNDIYEPISLVQVHR